MSQSIFISYRRHDSEGYSGRIYDRLREHFGTDEVFFDVDAIPVGVDFVDYLNSALSTAQVVLVIIGPAWLQIQADGTRRIDLPGDYVRLEIREALKRGIPVIPVLVGRATMPSADDLPDDLRALSTLNAAEIRSGPDFRQQVHRLIGGIEQVVTQRGSGSVEHTVDCVDAPESEPTEGLNLGQVVANYWEVTSCLGIGGTGDVYAVRHRLTEVDAALTVLHRQHADNPVQKQRYLEMARVTSKLRHPNLVSLLDAGEMPDGRVYLLMELCIGPTLAESLEREGPITPDRIPTLINQLCSALAVGHQQGVLHRDLKPKWIHLERSSIGKEFLKLRRLGTSEVKVQSEANERVRRTQLRTTEIGNVVMIGTPGYMSPEVIQGLDPTEVTVASDIYAAAVVIYEMLTGRLPHSGGNDFKLMAAQVSQAPASMNAGDGSVSVPAGVEAELFRALSPEPEVRHRSILELRDALLVAWNAPRDSPPPASTLAPREDPGSGPTRAEEPTVVTTQSPRPEPYPSTPAPQVRFREDIRFWRDALPPIMILVVVFVALMSFITKVYAPHSILGFAISVLSPLLFPIFGAFRGFRGSVLSTLSSTGNYAFVTFGLLIVILYPLEASKLLSAYSSDFIVWSCLFSASVVGGGVGYWRSLASKDHSDGGPQHAGLWAKVRWAFGLGITVLMLVIYPLAYLLE